LKAGNKKDGSEKVEPEVEMLNSKMLVGAVAVAVALNLPGLR